MYLYWNGGMTRFMPENIKQILPTIFVKNKYGNDEYAQSKDIQIDIESMEENVKDDHFKQFTHQFCGR